MRETFEAAYISTQADELPQPCIDAIVDLLLALAEQGEPTEQCCRCIDEAPPTQKGQPRIA